MCAFYTYGDLADDQLRGSGSGVTATSRPVRQICVSCKFEVEQTAASLHFSPSARLDESVPRSCGRETSRLIMSFHGEAQVLKYAQKTACYHRHHACCYRRICTLYDKPNDAHVLPPTPVYTRCRYGGFVEYGRMFLHSVSLVRILTRVDQV